MEQMGRTSKTRSIRKERIENQNLLRENLRLLCQLNQSWKTKYTEKRMHNGETER